MPLTFHPHPGHILVCDFSGFRAPEIIKKRPVIVVSSRLPHRQGLATVVPISLTAPKYPVDYVVRLSRNYHPGEDESVACWAKCDLLANVSFDRLDRFKVGRRKYLAPRADASDLEAVRSGVLRALGWVS
ncbi:MAG: type II toxin-antitoxin system PemK/MazF family toxin [Paracoccaceae bacterium]